MKILRKQFKFVRRFTFQFIVSSACNGRIRRLATVALHYLGWQPSPEYSVIGEETSELSIKLAPVCDFNVETPRFAEHTKLVSGEYPAIYSHLIKNGLASAYSSATVISNNLLLPRSVYDDPNRVLTDSAGLFQCIEKNLIVKVGSQREVESGILIGGAGAFNWYHFVMECAPKAFLATNLPTDYSTFPLLMPDECRSIEAFSKIAEMLRGTRDIIYLNRGEVIKVKNLLLFDEISIGPFNLVEGRWPTVWDYRQHDKVILQYIEGIRGRLLRNAVPSSSEKKLFLKRPGTRRNYNQTELIDIACRYGFEEVSPEELTLKQQAELFASASHVIGPSGAAWVGMIFRNLPLKGLSWLPVEYKEFSSYSTLACLLGHELNMIVAETPKRLRSTGEAYTSSYSVCPKNFENALQKIIESPGQ